MTDIALKTLEFAASQIGVREHGHNRGQEIDTYWRDIGMEPGGLGLKPVGTAKPWCAVFVSAMVRRAAAALGEPVPIHLTAGCHTLDEQAPPYMRTSVPAAGAIFLLNGHKHTGFVEAVQHDGTCITIEGNTSPGGSVEGDGVYRRTRKRAELLCFIDLNRWPPAPPASS